MTHPGATAASIIDPRWKVFLQVAQLGSMSGASVTLDLPQSVVSRYVSQLEKLAGAPLFRRTGRGVVLTDFGEEVHPRITALVQASDQLLDDMRTRSGEPRGDIRLGLLPSTAPLLAGPLSTEVRRLYPLVRLHFTEGSSAQLEEWLLQGRLDFALLLREDGVLCPGDTVLAEMPLCLVVPVQHPLAQQGSIPFQTVCTLPLLLPSEPHPLRARLNQLAQTHGWSLSVAQEADSIRLQHELVASGSGFAITAGTFHSQDAQRLAMLRVTDPVLMRSVVLGTTTHRPHTLASKYIGQLVRTLGARLLQTDRPAQAGFHKPDS